jgi:cobyric acid synthase
VLGICAGYQMLGKSVEDPQRIEGPQTSSAGLDLLEVHSTMTADKTLRPVSGLELTTGATIAGYEMHLGATSGPGAARPMIHFAQCRQTAASWAAICTVCSRTLHSVPRTWPCSAHAAPERITRNASIARSTRSRPHWNPHSQSIVC